MVFILSCKKEITQEKPSNSDTPLQAEPFTYQQWLQLPPCEQKAFDAWVLDSFHYQLFQTPHDTTYVFLREGAGPTPTATDSIIFAGDSAYHHNRNFAPPKVARFFPDCAKDTIYFNIGNPNQYNETYTFTDNKLHIHSTTPVGMITKTAFYGIMFWYEVDYYYRMRTTKLN
jgi:hypothetical protein